MTSELTSAQRQHLKALAHPLRPVVQVGVAGLVEGVVEATRSALAQHELVKVQLPRGESAARGESALALARATDSAVCQQIGRIVVLYRRRDHELRGRPRIVLP